MSHPQEPYKVKLIISLFSSEKDLISAIIKDLEAMNGKPDWFSPELFFDRTRYYAKEMGWPLHRRFIAFERLIPPDQLVDIKLNTNGIEEQYRVSGKRRINIDPGYISAERLILATGKNYTHRIYLSRGIYADLTLIFQRGSFRSLGWTYPDYSDPGTIEWFNEVRARYMKQLKEGDKRLD